MNNSTVQISVIVPFYNVEDYFEQCLDSLILPEGLLPEVEIILVDDCGNDNSADIAQRYCEQYPDNFVLLKNPQNLGLSGARNTGIDYATGQYLTFIDSDDYLEKGFLETLVSFCKTQHFDMLFFDFCRFWPNGDTDARRYDTAMTDLTTVDMSANPLLLAKVPVYAWGKIYHKDLFENFGYPVGLVNEDLATTPAILQKCKTIQYLPQIGLHYRERENSLSSLATVNPELYRKAIKKLLETAKHDDIIEYIAIRDLLFLLPKVFLGTSLERTNALLHSYQFLQQHLPNWKKNPYAFSSGLSAKLFGILARHAYWFPVRFTLAILVSSRR